MTAPPALRGVTHPYGDTVALGGPAPIGPALGGLVVRTVGPAVLVGGADRRDDGRR